VRVAPARDGRRVVAERIYNQLSSDLVVIDMRDDSVRTLGPGQRPCLSADERVVYFRAVDDPRRLQSIGIDGGTPTTIATFPHAILAIAHAPDGLHVSLLDGDRRHAWRVATGAAPVSEGLDGFVQPAPDGRWRAVGTVRDEDTRTLRLVPPGGDLATAGRTLVMTTPRVTWIDDTRLGYGHDGAFRVIDVTTGVELSAMPVGGLPLTYSALAGDGEHWFIIEEVARATRHLITNFADRPGADRRSRSPSVIELIVGDDGLGDSRQPANPVGRELVVRHVEPREPQRPARHPARIVVGDRAATDRVWQYARAGCPPRACHRRTCPG
jgi:hypothetical protein